VGPGGVGLPDRDYYVSEDADSKKKKERNTYLHVAKMLGFLVKNLKLKYMQKNLGLKSKCRNPDLTV
jgi:predicted metalloendopeptidase